MLEPTTRDGIRLRSRLADEIEASVRADLEGHAFTLSHDQVVRLKTIFDDLGKEFREIVRKSVRTGEDLIDEKELVRYVVLGLCCRHYDFGQAFVVPIKQRHPGVGIYRICSILCEIFGEIGVTLNSHWVSPPDSEDPVDEDGYPKYLLDIPASIYRHLYGFISRISNSSDLPSVIKIGRKGKDTRLIWPEVAPIGNLYRAFRLWFEDEFSAVEPRNATVESIVLHEFHLRRDFVVAVRLPVDLTIREAKKLSMWLSSLSFDDDSILVDEILSRLKGVQEDHQ